MKGVNWILNPINATIEAVSAFVFNGSVYVLDVHGALWSSGDGTNWSLGGGFGRGGGTRTEFSK